MNRTARHGSLRSEVYGKLREDILTGRYARGTALTEARITRDLGVSRTPVREALSQLALDGLVRSTPNKSNVVLGFDTQDIIDMYEVRRSMESLAAARAAARMTDEQLAELQAIYEREILETGGPNSAAQLQDIDNAFHEMIFRGSGSNILQNILSSISVYTRYARRISLAMPGRSQKVLAEHETILRAIAGRDSTAAAQAMSDHIDSAAASYLATRMTGGQTDA